MKDDKKTSKKEKKLKKVHKKNEVSGKGVFGEDSDAFKTAINKVQGWSKKYKTYDEIPDELIPAEYDFRNIEGFDFTGQVRD